jgi:P-type Cu+ transporter
MSDLMHLDRSRIELEIDGMTCASCAARIEKKLNRLDGVEATVNFATEKATVRYPITLTPDDLVSVVEQAGYSADVPPATGDNTSITPPSDTDDDSDSLRALRRRLVVSAVLTVPVVLLAMVPALQFPYWQWLSLVLTVPVVAWGGSQFHRTAWTNLRHGAASMDTLVSLGTLAAFVWSVVALFFGSAGEPGMTHPFSFSVTGGGGLDNIYLEAAAGVTTLVLAGRYAEARARRKAGAALRSLLELGAKDVAVLRDGTEVRVPIQQLRVGNRFVVRPGEKVATDGVVLDGTSAVDTSMLTGESMPIDVSAGDPVVGATINVGGRLIVKATRIGTDTQLAQLSRLVEDAQTGKAPVQRLADKISAVFVPVVIVVSIGTLVVWLLSGAGGAAAFSAAVAVLIIACPCALGLATPTALMVGTGRAAQLGIVIKGPEVLESTRRVDTIVLDKTGTLTTGAMSVHEVVPADGVATIDVLRLAGTLEAASDHPIARAIAAAATQRFGRLADIHAFADMTGLGVRGTVDGEEVLVGRRQLLVDSGYQLPPEVSAELEAAEAEGSTAVLVGRQRSVIGLLVVADTLKRDATTAVRQFRELGLTPKLLTGDHAAAAHRVADQVGIERSDVIAGVLPSAKVDAVRRLQAAGRVVAMVGDGVNDAAALAQADLGLAMGTGTDVAIEASDLTLVRGDLTVAVDAIRLSRRTLRTIKGNLFWAFAYNVAAIPLAAAGLLNPMIAGAAMAFSSVFVVSNSLRLRGFRATGRPASDQRPESGQSLE